MFPEFMGFVSHLKYCIAYLNIFLVLNISISHTVYITLTYGGPTVEHWEKLKFCISKPVTEKEAIISYFKSSKV